MAWYDWILLGVSGVKGQTHRQEAQLFHQVRRVAEAKAISIRMQSKLFNSVVGSEFIPLQNLT